MSSTIRTKRNRLPASPPILSYVPETPKSSSSGDKKGHNVKKNIKILLKSVDVLKATIHKQFQNKIFDENYAIGFHMGEFNMNYMLAWLKIYLDKLEDYYGSTEFKKYKLERVIEAVHQAIVTVQLYCKATKVYEVKDDKVKSLKKQLKKQYENIIDQPRYEILLDDYLVKTNDVIQSINYVIDILKRGKKTKKKLNKRARVNKLSRKYELINRATKTKVKNRLNDEYFTVDFNALLLPDSS
jgi:hypothetical protein